MTDRRCVICKHQGNHFSAKLDYSYVYSVSGDAVRVLLCRKHGVELFRSGQKNFFIRHYHILFDVFESQESDFLKVFHDEVKRNLDKIY